MNQSKIKTIVEALLFASHEPRSLEELTQLLPEVDAETVKAALEELYSDYESDERYTSFHIVEAGGGYQFRTRPEYKSWVAKMYSRERRLSLSAAALEVLACIAYRQPATRSDVDQVRGVDSSRTLKQLLERGLIRMVGRQDVAGRPIQYGTTREFLEVFGLKSLADLPSLTELREILAENEAQMQLLADDVPVDEPLDDDEEAVTGDETTDAEPVTTAEQMPLTDAPSSDTEDTTSEESAEASPSDADVLAPEAEAKQREAEPADSDTDDSDGSPGTVH